jgi:hypothetical protein
MLQTCISLRCGDIPERLQSPLRVAAKDALGGSCPECDKPVQQIAGPHPPHVST